MTRRQLSLYVSDPVAGTLNALRQLLDPVQARLIPAHVTLCREDELASIDPAQLATRMAGARCAPIHLQFGEAEVFDGHGILLPCIGGEHDFQNLRRTVLNNPSARRHAPHLTLAHPRNPAMPGNTLALAQQLPSPLWIRFDRAELIEQNDGSTWRVLETFEWC